MRQIQTYLLRTYGCQMNELDSEVMVGILEKRGLRRTEDEMEADLLLFNTCSVRDLAERKALGKLGQLCRKRAVRPIIGIAGCMASAKKESLFDKLPHLDFVIGTNNIHELNDILDQFLLSDDHQTRVSDRFSHELDYSTAIRNDSTKAYVSIIRGCNKYCTYCVVPYTRGPEVSRKPQDILEECSQLIDQGYKEITLLGQNVNSYGKDHPEWDTSFHDLLYQLDKKAKNSCWLRFMTSHPVDITSELMHACRDLSSVCEFVHFPLQAGSNRILKKMNRRYTKEEYIEKVSLFRSILPTVRLGTDIIVGFPSETEVEFYETKQALHEIGFSQAFLFAYSPRKGTPAFKLLDSVSKAEKEERLQQLITLQEEVYRKEREALIGTTMPVLIEGISIKEENKLKGRTRCWKNVVVEGNERLIGTFQTIQITGVVNQTLLGSLVDDSKTALP